MLEATRSAIAAAGLATLLASAAAAPASQAAAGGATIAIAAMAYAPVVQHARRGARVTWVNQDLVAHTVSAGDGSFRSPAIAPGASWSLVPAKAGTFAYACDFHPTMSATLVVE